MTIYALLAAVSDYPTGVGDLPGTMNDVRALDEFLRSYKDVNGIDYKPLERLNKDCTRDKLIKAFSHFDQAGVGDICIFFFSGHGAQMPAPPEFWDKERDRLCETIVCQDSREEGGRDLADKEIAYLLHKHVPEGAQCLALFDSCHSGTVTREAAVEVMREVTPKNLTANPKVVSFDDFEGAREYKPIAGDYRHPEKRDHVVLSACLDREVAVELNVDGKRGGLFTHSLIKTLREIDTTRLNYRELLERVQVRVANRHLGQTVYGEAVGGADLRGLFLNGQLFNQDLLLNYRRGMRRWFFRQGTVHGITPHSEVNGQTKKLSIISIEPGVTYVNGRGLTNRDKAYPVRVAGRNTPKLPVAVDASLSEKVRKAIADRVDSHGEHVTLVGADAGARFSIKNYGEGLVGLFEGNAPRPVFKTAFTEEEDFPQYFIDAVNRVGRYVGIQGLKPTEHHLSLDQAVDIKLEEVFVDADYQLISTEEKIWTEGQPVILPFRLDSETSSVLQPCIRVSVRVKPGYRANNGRLHIGMLIMDEAFNISDALLPMREYVSGDEWESTYSTFEGEEINFALFNIPYDMRERWGIGELDNYLKIVVSEQSLRLEDFNQPGLPQEPLVRFREKGVEENREPEFKGVGVDKTLARSVGKRWAVRDITLRLVYPEALRHWGVSGHPNVHILQAPAGFVPGVISLSSSGSVTRAISTGVKPPAFGHLGLSPAHLLPDGQEEADEMPLFRGDLPAEDLLVIYPASDQPPDAFASVTPDNPLRLGIGGAQDNFLVLGYDELAHRYYPVGLSDGPGEVLINQLPAPTEDEHTKSLGGSVKLFFQRLIAKRKGFPDRDLLEEVTVAADGVTTVVASKDPLKDRVKRAKRVALFIHGIIGDNSVSPGALRQAKYAGEPLTAHYDLVLTFDYENLGTNIGDIADNFRTSLQEVGLVQGHGKVFHIYAHSMGGLVSRHYIEMLDGDGVVSHLFQFGTPNNGSPLPNAYAYFMTGVTWLLSGAIVPFPWAAPAVTAMTWFTKSTQKALTDMRNGSDYLARLNQPRPRTTPYSLVNGNTRLLIPAGQADEEAAFWVRITRGLSLNAVVDAAFFRAENDLAVSLESQRTIPGPVDVSIEVACDHMSYFISPAGVEGLEVVFTKMMEKE